MNLLTFIMPSAVGPVNEVYLQSIHALPARHHDIAGLEVPVAVLLMHIIQCLQKHNHDAHADQNLKGHVCVTSPNQVPFRFQCQARFGVKHSYIQKQYTAL